VFNFRGSLYSDMFAEWEDQDLTPAGD